MSRLNATTCPKVAESGDGLRALEALYFSGYPVTPIQMDRLRCSFLLLLLRLNRWSIQPESHRARGNSLNDGDLLEFALVETSKEPGSKNADLVETI